MDVQAQSVRQYISYGDDAVAKGECYNGAEYYRQGLDKYEFNLELRFKYAEALRCFNDYQNAGDNYKKVVDGDVSKEYPMAIFWYGLMLHYQGRYEPAVIQFKKFLNRYKGKDYYHDKAQQEIESCSWAKANLKDQKINIIHLPDTINTPYSESNPFQTPDGHFLFSSLRNLNPPKKKEHFLARIYVSDSDYNTAKILPVPNTEAETHIANGAYNSDHSKFYFTQCEPAPENKSLLRCDIYVSKVFKDSLSPPLKLDSVINRSGYTSTQPNIGKNDKGEETLYFVSDRPGGYGRTDIWMSRIIRDTLQTPANLGDQVNTKDEEFSPFYDSKENKLYFASNWHYGFGGLDMFESTYENGKWSAPVNLGHAINSPQNDFYFYKTMDRSKNYFSSNRKGSRYIKSETCCNDIWMYQTGERIDVPSVVDTNSVSIKIDTPEYTQPTIAQTKIDTPIATITALTETKIDTQKSKMTAIAETPKATTNQSVTTTIETRKQTATAVIIPTTTSFIDTAQRVFINKTVAKMKQLLPVTLYFHNDEPDCCNLRDTTDLNYVETYQSYWRLLDRYKQEFSRGLKDSSKAVAEKEVFDLFTKKVDQGYYDLIQFSRQLLDALQSGQKIEITIQGYCSPLNYNQYNIQLGYRRVASLKNYFYHYRDGMLMYYVENGKLILKNESIGEERASKVVSDKREDTRNSVYNPAAALERKVEIISVELK